MPTPKQQPKQYRALADLALWKTDGHRPDPWDDPEQWLTWKHGEVFTPPAHFMVEKGLERGIIEEVTDA